MIGATLLLFTLYCNKQRANNNPKVYYVASIAGNMNARTIPPFGIYIKSSEAGNINLLQHELMHWKQFQREGLLSFIINYTAAESRYGYDKNPYEVEARFIENEFCKLNYTECVRNGTARTVFNPNFR